MERKPIDTGFSVEEAVRKRYSVRTYDGRPLAPELMERLLAYAGELENPLGPGMRLCVIEKGAATDASGGTGKGSSGPGASSSKGEKLGTYGFIKGARTFLAAVIPDEEYALEALGYEFEQLVLYAASLGIGTCWLGGTFDREAFTARITLAENEIFPILSPVGYPAGKRGLMEKLIRRGAGADSRLPWSQLFFDGDFGTPLTEAGAAEYRFPLEMVRLAPSAVNRQPWRVVKTDDGAFHFFEKRSSGKEEGVDIHRIDLGIAICHFHLAALELGLTGRFDRNRPKIDVPEGLDHISSWVMS